ncbi:TonB-dependent receptor plug domain-containing protein [Paludibacterium paludis]|uniref:Iron complex outermembrane receptor protein n=1 Tax=Paludibacterium paludis TaxID=1225769 RepID=A0A918P341_9NEIS|nr:TonB-dependent receptor [Paludibacterium paludis]GGY15340.1 hypothetical protein GCM10011289_18190 [Paludibacterium paludis]
MLKHTVLIAGIGTALPLAHAAGAADPSAITALEKITVTGSNLRATARAGANPVQVISAADIAKSGKSDLPDLLRSLSANSGNSFNEQFTGSFSAGTAGISLRGLGQRNTLILVNGKRVSNYATAQNLQETFVDLNSLPLRAVKRIEILKDGASAIYGSDAIAGVVNIILYPDYNGVETGITVGRDFATGQDEKTLRLLAGHGSLEEDGYNVWFAFDAQKRDRLDKSQVAWLKDGDFRGYPGGDLNRNVTNYYGTDPTNRFPRVSGPLADTDYATINPEKSGRVWSYNPADYSTLIPGIERYHAALRGTLKLNASTTAYAEFLFSSSRSQQIFGAPLTISSSLRAWDAKTQALVPISNVLPVGHPDNPNSTPTPVNATLFDLGTRYKSDTVLFRRLLAGLKGTTGNWDWDISGAYSDSRMREYATNFVNRYAFENLLKSGGYSFTDPAKNTRAVRDSLRLSTLRPAWYRIATLDATTGTELLELPAGPLGFAAGYQLRRESMNSRTSDAVETGSELRPALNIINGARTVQAAYAEVNVPVLRSLSLSGALRADHYSDFGNAFSPKLAIRYQPLDSLVLRGSVSRGFRAPSLPEITNSTGVSYGSVIDPLDPVTPNRSVGITHLTVANPNLQPERSTNANLGVVFSPTATTSVSLDYYRIRQSNIIGTESAQYIVRHPEQFPGRVVRDAQGKLVSISQQFVNLNRRTTSGIDADLKQVVSFGAAGKLVLAAQWSRLLSYREPQQAGGAPVEGAGNNALGSLPKWKGTSSLGWETAQWSSTLSWFHTGGYKQTVKDKDDTPDRVRSYNTFNLAASYKGFKRTTLTASIQNLTNRRPPWDPSSDGFDLTQADPRGRVFTIGVDYTFN